MRIFSFYGVTAVAALALVGLTAQANAQLVIVPTFASSITSDPNASTIEATINQAISTYENTFTNPITVHITYQEMGSGLGESETFLSEQSYSSVYGALKTNANTANALTAVASLPNQIADPVNGNSNLWLTTANARALGFSASIATDSTISLNTSICNLSPTGPQNGSFYSLLAVAEHETDEALGLGSGLNLVGQNFDGFNPYTLEQASRLQDLFRYSGVGSRSYSQSTNVNSYFSIDGGVTNLVGFNQTGGGADYGDWVSSATARVQDAFGTPGANESLLTDGGVELEALNVQGYTEAPQQSSPGTPEPGTLALFIGLGISSISAIRRGRKATA